MLLLAQLALPFDMVICCLLISTCLGAVAKHACTSSITLTPACVLYICPDDEDEFAGSLSLCSIDQDHDENCDVTAVDKFHGLRVAHPIEAQKIGQGITVGRASSCGLVVDDPSVGGRQQHITVPCIVHELILPLPDMLSYLILTAMCPRGRTQHYSRL